jgi:cold shock protein
MAIGTVKFFNADRGYGFITNEAGGKDAFVHISAVERSGMTSLREGQKLSYDMETGRDGKASATNLAAAE